MGSGSSAAASAANPAPQTTKQGETLTMDELVNRRGTVVLTSGHGRGKVNDKGALTLPSVGIFFNNNNALPDKSWLGGVMTEAELISMINCINDAIIEAVVGVPRNDITQRNSLGLAAAKTAAVMMSEVYGARGINVKVNDERKPQTEGNTKVVDSYNTAADTEHIWTLVIRKSANNQSLLSNLVLDAAIQQDHLENANGHHPS
jgi:hypothetical protein